MEKFFNQSHAYSCIPEDIAANIFEVDHNELHIAKDACYAKVICITGVFSCGFI